MREFKVGDKVTSEEFGDGVVLCQEHSKTYPVVVEFEDGLGLTFTKDGLYWSDNSVPHKNIKHKEAQGMNKSDLKTGMVVEYRDGWHGVVLADVGLIVGEQGWDSLENINEDLAHMKEASCDILKVYSLPALKRHYITASTQSRTLLWQREEVKEMTVDEISKALGYTVKVVGGE